MRPKHNPSLQEVVTCYGRGEPNSVCGKEDGKHPREGDLLKKVV